MPEHSEIIWVTSSHSSGGPHPMQRWKHHSNTGKLELCCKHHLAAPSEGCSAPVTPLSYPLENHSDSLQAVRIHGTPVSHLRKCKNNPFSNKGNRIPTLVSGTMPQLPRLATSTLTLAWEDCSGIQGEFGPRILWFSRGKKQDFLYPTYN